jgi:DNA-binding transcriptional LysR family regulator
MDLTWFEDFQALAETGNFSRAASLRHVTQPAFSRRIHALEDWAGVKLFDRAVQPVALTEAGRELLPASRDAVRQLLMAREAARAADRRSLGALRFAATHALSFTFFPAWLRGLEQGAQFATVHLISDSLSACERRMLLGEAQFLLCHYHRLAPGQLGEDAFASVPVGADTLCPVGSPSGTRDRLGYSTESGLGRIVAAHQPDGAAPVFTSHLAVTLKSMAVAGRGIAWLPCSLIAEELAGGLLVPADASDIPVEIRLFRRRAALSAIAEAFWGRVAR